MSKIGQAFEFMGELGKCVPWGDIDVAALVVDIANIKPEFVRFLKNGGRVMVGPNPSLNFDVNPYIPDGWSIRPEDQIGSRLKGRWELMIEKIKLHLDPGQQGVKVIHGDKLKKKLEGQSVLPAHVLDYLLKHPELIPEFWKGKVIFFWGTIYRDAGGRLCVRDLLWDGDRWDWNYNWLDNDWYENNPSAVSAS
jgi:hypothetical protein